MAGWVSEVRELLQETQERLDRLAGHLGEIEEGASRKVDLSRTRQMLAERIREVKGLEEELEGLRVEDLESALRSRDLLLEADLRRAMLFLDSWARTLGTPEAVQQVAQKAAEAVRGPLQAWMEEEARVLRASVESVVAARSGESTRLSAEVRAIRGLLDWLREHTAPMEERMARLEATLQQGVEGSLTRAEEASLQARGAAAAAGQATARAAQAEARLQSILSSLPSAEEVKVRLEGQAASLEHLSAEARSLSERLQRLPEALRRDMETAAALRRETAGLPAQVEAALHQAGQATEDIAGLRGQVEGLARRLQEEEQQARESLVRVLLRHEQALDELPARFPLWEEFETHLQALEQRLTQSLQPPEERSRALEARLQALEQKVSQPPPEPAPPLEARLEAVAAEVRGQVAALVHRLEALEAPSRPDPNPPAEDVLRRGRASPPPGPERTPLPDIAIALGATANHDRAAPPPRDPSPVSLVDRRGRRGALLTAIAVLDRDYRQGHLKPEEFEASLWAMRAARRPPSEPENPDSSR